MGRLNLSGMLRGRFSRVGSLSRACSEAGSHGQALSLGQAHRHGLTGRLSRAGSQAGSQGQILTGILSRAGSEAGPWGLGASFGSAVLAQVVFFIASHTTFLSSFFRFDVLVTIYLYDSL